GLGHEHGERGLAGSDIAEEPESAAFVEVLLDSPDELTHLEHEVGIHVHDRLPVERHAAIALGDAGTDPAAGRAVDASLPTGAGARDVRLLVEQPAAAVAEALRAEARDLGRLV